MLQSRLTAGYLDLVKDLYTEPGEDRVVGDLFNFVMTLPPMVNTPAPVKRKKKASAINASGNRDIREMFGASKKKKTPKSIAIDFIPDSDAIIVFDFSRAIHAGYSVYQNQNK